MAEEHGADVEELIVKVEPVYWENCHEDEMEVNIIPVVTTGTSHVDCDDNIYSISLASEATQLEANTIKREAANAFVHSTTNPVQMELNLEGMPLQPFEVRDKLIHLVEEIKEVDCGIETSVFKNERQETVIRANFKVSSLPEDNYNRKEHSLVTQPTFNNNDLVQDVDSLHYSVTHVCLQCDKVCKNKCALKSHMRVHNKEKWNKCPICSKSFYKQSDLARHARLHTGDKPFVCEVCGKSFSDPSYFRQHNRFHKGIKPYKCSFCNVAFTQKSHLTTHQRSHSGEKPYQCNLCEKTFGRRDYLKSHILAHSGVKSFHCSFCDKSFSKSSHLKAHVRSHTKEKPYGCETCPSQFTRRSDLTRHRLRQHRNASRGDAHI